MSTTISSVGEDIGTLLKSFERYLRATNKAHKTIKSYTDTVRRFRDFLAENGMPTDRGIQVVERPPDSQMAPR